MSDYYDDKLARSATSYKACFWAFIAMVVGVIIAACFSGCKSVQYVPVETIRTEIEHVHDTVRIQDSAKHEKQLIIREADSAEIERLNTEYGFKLDKAQRTILILRKELERTSHQQTESKDSIIYKEKEAQVPSPVEKKLTRWQQIKMDFGGGVIVADVIVLIVVVLVALLYLRRMRQRNV